MNYQYNKLAFNKEERSLIDMAITLGASQDILDIMTRIRPRSGGQPAFNIDQINCINDGLLRKFSDEQIKLYTVINNYGYPIFDKKQMKEIIDGFVRGLKWEEVQLYAQNVDGKAKFRYDQMKLTKEYLLKANSEQIKQFRNFINNDKLCFGDYNMFFYYGTSADKMRICHSLYDMGCVRGTITKLIKNCNYEEMKSFKYLTKCAENFGIDINIVAKIEPFSIGSVRHELLNEIEKKEELDIDESNIINTCICNKMSPEQINFLISRNNCFSANEMQYVANAFFDGVSVDMAKEFLKSCYTWDGIRDPQLVHDFFEDATKSDIIVKSENDHSEEMEI